MEYTIVESASISALEKHVEKLIAQGWKPQGGVSTYISSTQFVHFVQALVRVKRGEGEA